MTAKYEMVTASIPIMSVPLKFPAALRQVGEKFGQIDQNSPVIVFGIHDFVFGHLKNFTKDLASDTNKHRISHEDGTPQAANLVADLKKWHEDQQKLFKIKNPGFVILLPQDSLPVAIILQVIQFLKGSGLYSKIILGSDIF